MSKEEFLKLSDLDKVKYAIEESLKEHKGYKSEYWKGSAFMGESILQTIEQVKKFAIPVVVKSFTAEQVGDMLAKDFTTIEEAIAYFDGIE